VKITIGEWKTRDGRKAIVAAENNQASEHMQLVGWIEPHAYSWARTGRHREFDESKLDLVAPWTDPVPWDWSTTPPWLNCLIQGPSGQWYLCEAGVDVGNDGLLFNGSRSIQIPTHYAPKWTGDWKLSKTMRPGYKEAK
jgi:hypothetical protein